MNVGMGGLEGFGGNLAEWIPNGIGLGIGLLAVRVFAMLLNQWNLKEDRLEKGHKTVFDTQQQQIASLLEWKDQVEAALKECREQHASSQLEVAKLKGLLAGFGDARQHAQLIIAADKVANGEAE